MKPTLLEIIDAITKALVLLVFTGYIGLYIYLSIGLNKPLNLPDWIVSVFTIVFMYFFRRALKTKNNKDGA